MERGVNTLDPLCEDWSLLVYGLTNDIDNATKSLRANRNLNRSSRVMALLSSDEAVSGLHSDGTHSVFSKMLRNLKNKAFRALSDIDLERIENLGKLLVELKTCEVTARLSSEYVTVKVIRLKRMQYYWMEYHEGNR